MKHDVTILGSGPAGLAAAMLLKKHGLTPVLVKVPGTSGKQPASPDWISARAVDALKESGLDCTAELGEPFAGMKFHSGDLKKTSVSKSADPPAWQVDFASLSGTMLRRVRQAGVDVVDDASVTRIELGDKRVRLEFQERDAVEASFLILADGAARTFATVGAGQPPPVASPPARDAVGRWFASMELAMGRGREAKAAADADMHWLLSLDRNSCFLWWWSGQSVVLSLLAGGTGKSVVQLLCETAKRIAAAGLIPAREQPASADIMLRAAPVRSALEIETHVEKRCLLIGDAGGFLSETSGEGIYPAVWSARLAVEAVAAAMNSPHPQDELRQFSTAWRSTMADFLRPPNTDVHFLVPLIFSNRQMADRMAAAFWKGTNI